MSEHTLPLARRFNSWNDSHPLELSHPPLGLTIRPALYAASRNAFTDLPIAAGGVTLGPRTLEADPLFATVTHAGTTLDWSWDKAGPFAARGGWRAAKLGEWGLRFWVVLLCELRLPDGSLVPWRYEPESGLLSTRSGADHVVVLGRAKPLMASFHDSAGAVAEEFAREGYFYLGSRGTEGAVAALRYHLDEMPAFDFAVATANDRQIAADLARGALDRPAPAPPEPLHRGRHAGALDALRDVVAWNTVFDRVNRRPYTALSRYWVAQKFGGYGVWLNDVLFHALMAAHLDAEVARENLVAATAAATAQGNLPCLVTGRDAWVDRSQPPIGGYLLWCIATRLGDRGLVALLFDALLANHLWWRAHRDGNGDGLYAYGTSPLGEGLYRGTRLGARNESCMDNAAVHDEAVLDTASGTLDMADVGLNSLLALDAECLADLARRIGRTGTAEALAGFAEAQRARVRERLWDPERQVFANRLWSGRFVRSLAPTSFYPLLAGAADESQAAAMAALLDDETKFGGEWLLPGVTRDDPAFADNVYWRGRIWPPFNYLAYQGLKRAGADAAAGRLADNSWALFQRSWERRLCPENFSAVTGEPDDQPDTDLFYGWGGLMPAIAVAELADVSPWRGLTVGQTGVDYRLGPLLLPGGAAVVESRDGQLTVTLEGRPRLSTDIAGRLERLELSERSIALTLPTGAAGAVACPGLAEAAEVAAFLDGKALGVARTGNGTPVVQLGGGGRLQLTALG